MTDKFTNFFEIRTCCILLFGTHMTNSTYIISYNSDIMSQLLECHTDIAHSSGLLQKTDFPFSNTKKQIFNSPHLTIKHRHTHPQHICTHTHMHAQ